MNRKLAVLSMCTIISAVLIASHQAMAQTGTDKVDYVVNDTNFYPIPVVSQPLKGESYIDPLLNTRITRLTNSIAEVPRTTSTGKTGYAQPGYPKHDIENADGSMLIVQSYASNSSGWHIYNANPPYNKIKEIPIKYVGWGSPIDARWDAQDPNIIYYQWKKTMWKYNVATDENIALHDFGKDFPPVPGTNYPSCSQTMQEEGKPSDDSRYWAFNIRCYDPSKNPTWFNVAKVVYDKDYYNKDKGKVISSITPDNPIWQDAGFVSMSPSGKYVWTGDVHRVYDRDFTARRDLGCANHADITYNTDGKEVVVCGQRYYKGGYTDLGTWLKMVDIETGESNWLAPMGSGGYHISGLSRQKPGWAVVSTYTPNYPYAPTKWADQAIYMVKLEKMSNVPDNLNHAPVWRVANTRSERKSYSDDPFAKINRKGTKIFFGSNWGIPFSLGGKYDLYQVNLPATWYEDLNTY